MPRGQPTVLIGIIEPCAQIRWKKNQNIQSYRLFWMKYAFKKYRVKQFCQSL